MRQNESGQCIPLEAPGDTMFYVGRMASLTGMSAGIVFIIVMILALCYRIPSNSCMCRCGGTAIIVIMSGSIVCCSLALKSDFCEGVCDFTFHGIILYVAALFWIISGVMLFSVHDFVESARVMDRSPTHSHSPLTSSSTSASEGCGISVIESTGQSSVFQVDSAEGGSIPNSKKTDRISDVSYPLREGPQTMQEITAAILSETPANIDKIHRQEQLRVQKIVGVVGREDPSNRNEERRTTRFSKSDDVEVFVDTPGRVQPEVLPFFSMSGDDDTLEKAENSSCSRSVDDPRCTVVNLAMATSSSSQEERESVPSTIAFR